MLTLQKMFQLLDRSIHLKILQVLEKKIVVQLLLDIFFGQVHFCAFCYNHEHQIPQDFQTFETSEPQANEVVFAHFLQSNVQGYAKCSHDEHRPCATET